MFLTNVDRLVRSRVTMAGVALALAAISAAWAPAWAQSRQERVTIIEIDAEPYVENWRYSPPVITVPVGTRVTWFNTGRRAHTVTSREGLFDSGPLDSSASWSYEFDTPGIYSYFCGPFTWMKGTVIVRAQTDSMNSKVLPTATPFVPTPDPESPSAVTP